MSYESPTPDNNPVLRQVQGLRREMHEMTERQARAIDLVSRLGERMERGFDDVRRDVREVKSDLILMENRVLTAQSDILRIVQRADDGPDSDHDASRQP